MWSKIWWFWYWVLQSLTCKRTPSMSLSHNWHTLVNELILLVIFVSGNDFVNVIVLLIIRSYVDMSLRSIFGKATMHLIPQDSLSVLMWAVRESYNNIVYYPQVLCQPLFLNYTNNHICRVLSPTGLIKNSSKSHCSQEWSDVNLRWNKSDFQNISKIRCKTRVKGPALKINTESLLVFSEDIS